MTPCRSSTSLDTVRERKILFFFRRRGFVTAREEKTKTRGEKTHIFFNSKNATIGSLAAEKACEEFGVASQNDAKKLADAKAAVYLKGFTEGVMLVGDHAGEKVSDAKPKLKATLVAAGDGIIYSEPERAVVSRSGDACVVALTDQWYLTYGEDEWAASARECLSGKDRKKKKRRREFFFREREKKK